jgi:hypothetical protein
LKKDFLELTELRRKDQKVSLQTKENIWDEVELQYPGIQSASVNFAGGESFADSDWERKSWEKMRWRR